MNETGSDKNFASAVSIIAIIITSLIFLLQRYINGKYKFTMNPYMLGKLKPVKFLIVLVINPFLPNNKIQEYAPINGADILHSIIVICKKVFPLILYILQKYAKGIPIIKVKVVAAKLTLNELNIVEK